MSFKLENFGADASNVKSILGGVNYYRYFNKDNNTLTTPGYFPADLGLAVGDRIRVVPSVKTNADELYVVTNITNRTVTVAQIDTDGAVDSVNGKTGQVVLDASDVDAVAQLSTMPTASADTLGDIVQFVGTTDANYTNGYFYKCVSDGQEPATYSWTQVNVQPAPDALQNTATGTDALTILGTPSENNKGINIGAGSSIYGGSNAIAVGYNSSAGNAGVAVGSGTTANSTSAVAIGEGARATGYGAIQIGSGTNSATNSLKVKGYQLMSSDGTVPADRLGDTTGLTAGNYRPRLTIDAQGNQTITWVAE